MTCAVATLAEDFVVVVIGRIVEMRVKGRRWDDVRSKEAMLAILRCN